MISRLTIQSMPCGRSRLDSAPLRPYAVNIDVASGESVVIVGGVGTGKTECAFAMAGLADGLPAGMSMLLDGEDLYSLSSERRAQLIGIVPCQPHLIFSCIASSLHREMELCFAFLGRDPDQPLIDEISALMRIDHLMDHNPLLLSGGEKVRLAIALGLLKKPAVMVFDDALRELDPITEQEIQAALDSFRSKQGLVTVEFQTRPRETSVTAVNQWLFITQGGVTQGTLDSCWRSVAACDSGLLPPYAALAARLEQAFNIQYPAPPTSPDAVAAPFVTRRTGGRGEPVDAGSSLRDAPGESRLSVSQLAYCYPNNAEFRLGPISHIIASGTVTGLLGQNGAGKTTGLRCLGNLITDWTGEIEILPGLSASQIRLPGWARAVLYCFQNPDDQLFLGTVREEMRVAAKFTRDRAYDIEPRAEQVAEELGFRDLLDTSPADLPRPLRRMVTLGAALVANPPVLLLDEPTVDLDEELIRRVVQVILRYRDAGGTVVLVSHDYDFVGNVCDEVLLLERGTLSRKASRREQEPWPFDPAPCVARVAQLLDSGRIVWAERDLFELLKS